MGYIIEGVNYFEISIEKVSYPLHKYEGERSE